MPRHLPWTIATGPVIVLYSASPLSSISATIDPTIKTPATAAMIQPVRPIGGVILTDGIAQQIPK